MIESKLLTLAANTRTAVLDLTDGSAMPDGVRCIIYNKTSAGHAVYIGGPDVTTANGVPLAKDAYFQLQLETDEVLFAISSEATELRVITGGLKPA